MVTTGYAYAQTTPVLVKLDFGFSNVKASSGKGDNAFSYGAGIESFVPIINGTDYAFLLNLGISYQSNGYEGSIGFKVKTNYANFVLPVLLKLGKGGLGYEEPAIYIGLGPFMSYALSGKYRQQAIDDYTKMKFGNSLTDNRRSYDAGLAIKAGFQIKRVSMSLQKNIGFANLIPKERITGDEYIRSRNFLFSVAYALNVRSIK